MKNSALSYYCIEDIAQMLDVTDRTVRNYLKSGILQGVKVGGQWRFTEAQVSKLFAGETVKVKPSEAVVKENSEDYEPYSYDALEQSPPSGLVMHAVIEKKFAGFNTVEVDLWREKIQRIYKNIVEASNHSGTMEFVYDEVGGFGRWRVSGTFSFINLMMKGFESYE